MATKPGRRTYVPERGDVVWLQFNPQRGHEQAGIRPAVVLSPRVYNERALLLVAVPITRQIKGYPFEVLIPAGLPIAGAVLADQLKSVDWHARAARFICSLPEATIREILTRSTALLSM